MVKVEREKHIIQDTQTGYIPLLSLHLFPQVMEIHFCQAHNPDIL